MIKTLRRVIGLCAITSLLAISITSCQQPTGGETTKTPDEIISAAKTALTFPEYTANTKMAETFNLPADITVDGKKVTVKWEKTSPDTDFTLTGNSLTLKRNIADTTCTLKATLTYEGKTADVENEIAVPAIKEFSWTYKFDDSEGTVAKCGFKFLENSELEILLNGEHHIYSYSDLNTENNTIKLLHKGFKFDDDYFIKDSCATTRLCNYSIINNNEIQIKTIYDVNLSWEQQTAGDYCWQNGTEYIVIQLDGKYFFRNDEAIQGSYFGSEFTVSSDKKSFTLTDVTLQETWSVEVSPDKDGIIISKDGNTFNLELMTEILTEPSLTC